MEIGESLILSDIREIPTWNFIKECGMNSGILEIITINQAVINVVDKLDTAMDCVMKIYKTPLERRGDEAQ